MLASLGAHGLAAEILFIPALVRVGVGLQTHFHQMWPTLHGGREQRRDIFVRLSFPVELAAMVPIGISTMLQEYSDSLSSNNVYDGAQRRVGEHVIVAAAREVGLPQVLDLVCKGCPRRSKAAQREECVDTISAPSSCSMGAS